MEKPETLADAISLYAHIVNKKAVQNLRSTLSLYVLSEFRFQGMAKVRIRDYPIKIKVSNFIENAIDYFESAYQLALKQGKNEKTLRNNRSHLNCFIEWIKLQPWYSEVVEIQEVPKRAPSLKAEIGIHTFHRGRRAFGTYPYALRKEELNQNIRDQINALHTYLTAPYVPARKTDSAIREVSWATYKYEILHFLGWLHHDTTGTAPNLCCPVNRSKKSLDELDITLMADKEVLNEYLTWHFSVRGNGCRQGLNVCTTALNIAKWHYGKDSKRAKFADCEQVLDIREIQSILSINSKTDRRTTSPQALSEKLLEFEQCQEIVKYLRLCCAEKTKCGDKRNQRTVINAWQNYLLLAILTYTPVRQREIREMELGKSLKREETGWWVTLTADQHKTGSKTGKSRAYPLFAGPMKEQLTHDLDTYVNKWRPLAQLSHNYLFFLRGSSNSPTSRGLPIPTSDYLSHLIPRQVLRVTASLYGKENVKTPSPHDFRRIFCNWLYTYGTLEEQESYAELMGHSVEEARRTYALVESRTKTERVDVAFKAVEERARRIQATKQQNKDNIQSRWSS